MMKEYSLFIGNYCVSPQLDDCHHTCSIMLCGKAWQYYVKHWRGKEWDMPTITTWLSWKWLDKKEICMITVLQKNVKSEQTYK